MSKSHSSSTQQQQSTQALDPQVKAAILGNYDALGQNVPGYTPYSGQKVANFTPAQLQAQGLVGDIATNQTGAAPLNSAITTAQGVAGYTPQSITAPSAQASLIDMSKLPQVTGGALSGIDLSKYMDPYTQSVVDTTANDLNMQRQRDLNTSQQQATLAGAWRGDRQGVADALTNEASDRTLASTIANLRSQGYGLATQNAEADLNRRLSADQGNQSTALSAAGTNAGLGTNVSLANASSALDAAKSNQSAGLAGANLNLESANTLAGLSTQQLQEALQRASALGGVGDAQQAQQQAQLDWQYQNGYLNPQQYAFALQQLKNQTLGLAGDPTLTQSSGTSTGKSSGWSLFGNGGVNVSAGGGG